MASIVTMGNNMQDLTFRQARNLFDKASAQWPGDPTDDTAPLIADQCPFVIKAAVFEGIDKAAIRTRATISGSILSQTQQALDFVRDHDRNRQSWPIEAVKAAIVNAVMHRDYGYSGATTLSLFPDRLEIVSLGGLVAGLKLNDLINGVCQPRDPALAEWFEKLGLCENFGTGIALIIHAYQHCDPAPHLSVGPHSVSVTLPRATRLATGHDAGGAARVSDPKLHPNVVAFPTRVTMAGQARAYLAAARVIGIEPVETALLRQPDWSCGLIPDGADESLEEITLSVLASNGHPLTRAQLQETLQLSKGRMNRVLLSLEAQERIRRIGRSRATRYELA